MACLDTMSGLWSVSGDQNENKISKCEENSINDQNNNGHNLIHNVDEVNNKVCMKYNNNGNSVNCINNNDHNKNSINNRIENEFRYQPGNVQHGVNINDRQAGGHSSDSEYRNETFYDRMKPVSQVCLKSLPSTLSNDQIYNLKNIKELQGKSSTDNSVNQNEIYVLHSDNSNFNIGNDSPQGIFKRPSNYEPDGQSYQHNYPSLKIPPSMEYEHKFIFNENGKETLNPSSKNMITNPDLGKAFTEGASTGTTTIIHSTNGKENRSVTTISITKAEDSDDSGTVVCSGGEGDGYETQQTPPIVEGIRNFHERFGHLFNKELPPPIAREVVYFQYMPSRNSKRRAPLPPAFLLCSSSEHKSSDYNNNQNYNFQRQQEYNHYVIQCQQQEHSRRRQIRKSFSSTSLDSQSESPYNSELPILCSRRSYRKSIKKRLSLVGLFPSSRQSLSKVSEYFTQTAPGKIQSPAQASITNSQDGMLSTTSSFSTFSLSMQSASSTINSSSMASTGGSFQSTSATSTGSFRSTDPFSSFPSSPSTLSKSTSGSYLLAIPQMEESDRYIGTYQLIGTQSDFYSTGSSTLSSTSWGTSSFSSLQTLDSKDGVKPKQQDFKPLTPPTIPFQQILKSQKPSDPSNILETQRLATVLPSGIRSSIKPSKSLDVSNVTATYEDKGYRRRSSSVGCYIEGIPLHRPSPIGAENPTESECAAYLAKDTQESISKSQKLLNSIRYRSLRYRKISEEKKITKSGKKRLLRSWLSAASLAPDSDIENEKSNVANWARSKPCSESDSGCASDDVAVKQAHDALSKSRSDTAINQIVDVNSSLAENKKLCIDSNIAEVECSSHTLENMRVMKINKISAHVIKDASKNVNEYILKEARIIVLPHDVNYTEPPIYENVTYIIKPKPPARPLVTKLKHPLPLNAVFDQVARSEIYASNDNYSKAKNIRNENRILSVEGRRETCDASDHLDSMRKTDASLNHEKGSCLKTPPCSVILRSINSNMGSDHLSVASSNQEKQSPTLVDLVNGKLAVNSRKNPFQVQENVYYSNPSSPIGSRKKVSPRIGGTVKELIQRFSSMDNLSVMNNTLPCRSPKKGKVKHGVRNVLSHDLEHSRQFDEFPNKYCTWDKSISHEYRKSFGRMEEEKSNRNDTTIVENNVDNTINNKNYMPPGNSNSGLREASITSDHEMQEVSEHEAEDSPFTSMIKRSHVLKSVRSRYPDYDIEEGNEEALQEHEEPLQEHEEPHLNVDFCSKEENGVFKNASFDYDSVFDNSVKKLPLVVDLGHPCEYSYSEGTRTPSNKSLDFHIDANSCTRLLKTEQHKFSTLNKHNNFNKHASIENIPNTVTNVKKSPFQKFKETLLNSLQQQSSDSIKACRKLPTDTGHNVTADNSDVNNFSDNSAKKSSKMKSYIQLKSLRTWKDVKLTKMDNTNSYETQVTNAKNSDKDDTSGFSSIMYKLSSPSSAKGYSNGTSVISSEFSSYPSSKASSIRSPSPEESSDPNDVNNLGGPHSGSFYPVNLDISRNQQWKFGPICNSRSTTGKSQSFNESHGQSETLSSIHDLERSITYVNHQPSSSYHTSNSAANDQSMYSKMFKNPMKYLKQPPFSLNLIKTNNSYVVDGTATEIPYKKQRRHTLSNFSPAEVLNNGVTSKKLTPSSLYPMTLSPTSPESGPASRIDWTYRRKQLPPPPPPPPSVTEMSTSSTVAHRHTLIASSSFPESSSKRSLSSSSPPSLPYFPLYSQYSQKASVSNNFPSLSEGLSLSTKCKDPPSLAEGLRISSVPLCQQSLPKEDSMLSYASDAQTCSLSPPLLEYPHFSSSFHPPPFFCTQNMANNKTAGMVVGGMRMDQIPPPMQYSGITNRKKP